MRKSGGDQGGFTLIELLVGSILMVILLAGMVTLFAASLRIWTVEKNSTNLEQTARIAVDKIMGEVRYGKTLLLNNAHSLQVIKPSGEINTFQLGREPYDKTLYVIIDKEHAISTGGTSRNPITENVVTSLVFTSYPSLATCKAVIITLEVTDPFTGRQYRIHTAGYPWNSRENLL